MKMLRLEILRTKRRFDSNSTALDSFSAEIRLFVSRDISKLCLEKSILVIDDIVLGFGWRADDSFPVTTPYVL